MSTYTDYDLYNDYADLESLEMLIYIERLERREARYDPDRSLHLDTMDENEFRNQYHFSKAAVESIIEILSPKLESNAARIGVLKPAEKICIALSFFANGGIQSAVADIGRISQPSSSRAINSVAKCLAEVGKSFIKFPSNVEVNEIAKRFKDQSGLPGVVGVLDCLQVPVLNPGGSEAWQFRNRKGLHSLNIQTLSDDMLKIRNIVARWPGGSPKWLIFDSSRLRAILESNAISNTNHVLGDSEYPIRQYLLTPIPSPKNAAESRFNLAHERARSSVERMYGLWKGRFPCISQTLKGSLPNSQNIIVATAVLHNMAIDLGDGYEIGDEPEPQGPCLVENSAAGISRRDSLVEAYFA